MSDEDYFRVSKTIDRAVPRVFGENATLYKEYRPIHGCIECSVYKGDIRVDFVVPLECYGQSVWTIIEHAKVYQYSRLLNG